MQIIQAIVDPGIRVARMVGISEWLFGYDVIIDSYLYAIRLKISQFEGVTKTYPYAFDGNDSDPCEIS